MKVYIVSCGGWIHSVHTSKAVAERDAEDATTCAAMGGSHDYYTVTEKELFEDDE